ncbi:hypothetical protein ASU31_00215 [Pedobacter ginsenosidimutans]|uniref:Uncharacterized protein n=1 Tax=Pedobacter ginsenosidimutans TaxID=687842 RepID=A0A0T5VVB2_9SPHI|nr:hypothetical protein [Pedobacter ginsenosidimutans]KRT17757.1 hypothetical protein ASU31_00215 [Pedobacter ginsenosidimutans]
MANNLKLINVTLLLLSINPNVLIIGFTAILAFIAVPIAKKNRDQSTILKRYDVKAKISLVAIFLVGALSLWNEHDNARDKEKQGQENENLRSSIKSLSSENTFIMLNLKLLGLDYRNGQFFPATEVARQLIAEMNKTKGSEDTFSLGFNSSFIREYIENHSKHKYSLHSPLVIKIGYSGEIIKENNGLYQYPGGFLTVEIDKLKQKQVLDIELTRTYQAGSQLSSVEKDLQAQIEVSTRNSPMKIAKAILQCLN